VFDLRGFRYRFTLPSSRDRCGRIEAEVDGSLPNEWANTGIAAAAIQNGCFEQ
jgi:hypothetical protein